jgi:SAM-dependent methyltransferase
MNFMTSWALRSIRPELLDDAPEPDRGASLNDLTRINRLLGGHFVLRRLLARYARPSEPFSLLDVGAGSGDMGAAIARSYPNARIVSLDRQRRHLAAAPPPRVAADAFHLPFAPASFDFVFCSLFLHHFSDDAVVALLASFARLARRAVLVIDLDRQRAAYRFIPATRWLFGWNRVTLHDAPVSVRASFRKHELADLARRAGLAHALVRRHHPWFRLSLAAPPPRP